MHQRGSGILLHISSLPSEHGIGDLGPGAYRFVDFLFKAKQSYWQILPLNPTDGIFGHSPYSSFSAFAGNTLFISPELLVKEGWLKKEDIQNKPFPPPPTINYEEVIDYKNKLFNSVWNRCRESLKNDKDFEEFFAGNKSWLEDFAVFSVLKKIYSGLSFNQWPEDIRKRDHRALLYIHQKFGEHILREEFFQYIFFKQWGALKDYCKAKGIELIGDVPIYVNDDSADVWTNPEIFKLNNHLEPEYVAGVPPDYFSATGQRWGNPIYNWERLKETNFTWWIKRLEHNLRFFDRIRLDHFRGFVSYWEIPVLEKTAIHGRWVKAPGEEFFASLQRHFKTPPFIAEDLGMITPEVEALRDELGFPGMKVLQFALHHKQEALAFP